MKRKLLRQIPAVNDLLADESAISLIESYSREQVKWGIGRVTDDIRNKILKDKIENIALSIESILQQVEILLKEKFEPALRNAVNATGTVIHTNLGRSVLSESAQQSLQMVAQQYSTLEIDRKSGSRGSRCGHLVQILQELTGAEDAYIVNNNAAAVLLALNTLAVDREVIISRGELVEIGGSFRIPDVMEKSGGSLVEVGTTNKVYIEDYRQAISEETGLLLKVHTSNYKILGFTETVQLKELVQLGRETELPVMEDLGSGCLRDLSGYGLSYEPTVGESIEAGADVVTFSGDKLLGGPQSGIIIGRQKYIEQIRNNPLARALRVDKFTLAALEATLKEYLRGAQVYDRVPTLKMLTEKTETIKERALKIYTEIEDSIAGAAELAVKKDYSRVGGGSYPLEKLETHVIALKPKGNTEEIAEELRFNEPPIFARIADDSLIFDPRSLLPGDDEILVKAIKKIFK